MKLGQRTQKQCKHCHTWTVFVCGEKHTGIFGATELICKQCNKIGEAGLICDYKDHPPSKPRWDV